MGYSLVVRRTSLASTYSRSLIPCAAASLPIYLVMVRYNPTMRAIRRLDALARSKLFATVTESLKSLDAFRQYGRIAELMRTVDERIDASSRAHHLRFALVGWNAAILGWCGAVLMLIGALIAVSQRYVIEPARIGLTLGALLTAFRGLQYIVRLVVEVDVAVRQSRSPELTRTGRLRGTRARLLGSGARGARADRLCPAGLVAVARRARVPQRQHALPTRSESAAGPARRHLHH